MAESIIRAVEGGPSEALIIRRGVGDVFAATRDLWSSWAFIRALAEREIRARYKQAYLGIAWAIVTPLVLMIVFSLVVGRVADIDTSGVPYPLFTYVALVPWAFFTNSMNKGGTSIVVNKEIMRKVPIPRETFPMSSVVVAAFDALVATALLGVLFLFFGFPPKATSWMVPLILLVLLLFTVGVTLLTSAVIVYLRDLRHALPIIVQVGLFATPIAYSMEQIPERFQALYSILNPLGPVMDALRSTILFGEMPQWDLFGLGAASSLVIFAVSLVVFRRLEFGFADVA
jgi:ABC-type polysaccharide/polyol phosphate export permease